MILKRHFVRRRKWLENVELNFPNSNLCIRNVFLSKYLFIEKILSSINTFLLTASNPDVTSAIFIGKKLLHFVLLSFLDFMLAAAYGLFVPELSNLFVITLNERIYGESV